MELLDFLNKNYYILVPALWVVGYALKQTPKIANWTIIWILLGLAIMIGTFAFGFSVDAILNGIIAAGVAVLGHQMFKQTLGGKFTTRKVITVEEKKTEKIEETK
ncbi:phage holin family protein [Robertmurraya massiliosenegalensis]|uniref:phage holin family protein n=1 Tax=Robertmurraya massiliosenegalensis TaxID=1287657 RepID=UPI0002F52037|nr:phage holin family protein [Robertmurraya massiliosenegalensis]